MAELAEPVVYVRGDRSRIVYNSIDRVNAEYDGFKPQSVAKAEKTDETFDPSIHSVKEVQAYLATADDVETARVLSVEAAGQNRPSLVK